MQSFASKKNLNLKSILAASPFVDKSKSSLTKFWADFIMAADVAY